MGKVLVFLLFLIQAWTSGKYTWNQGLTHVIKMYFFSLSPLINKYLSAYYVPGNVLGN